MTAVLLEHMTQRANTEQNGHIKQITNIRSTC